MPINLTLKEKEIICNIIGAVETGGQVYGNRDYSNFTQAKANVSTEVAITIGAYQHYGTEAKHLLNYIRETNPTVFNELDNMNIGYDLDNENWNYYGYNTITGQPSILKKSPKAKCIQSIISSPVGKQCQDNLVIEQIIKYMEHAQKLGVKDVDAQIMCANFEHQGGTNAPVRILKKTQKPYNLDNIYKACQSDTGNQVGAYRNRQQMVYNSLKKYLPSTIIEGEITMTKSEAINKLIKIAEAEIGYLEKRSNANLDDKTANAGSNNYTKYWRDMANLGIGDYQAQYWCACFVHWCFYKAFGLKTSQSLLLQKFFINCQVMHNLAKSKAQLDSTPKVGDVVLFWTYSTSQYGHTGIVVSVDDGKTFTTIEGNTSGGSTVVANGGGVAKKTYVLSNLSGVKFMRPNYNLIPDVNVETFKRTNSATCTGNLVNVRLTPGGTIIGQLSKGNRFDVDGQVSSDWVHINVATIGEGWMYKDYVQLDKVATTTKPTPKPSTVKLITVNGVQFPELRASKKPSGSAVGLVQAILGIKVTNSWNSDTTAAVKAFKGSKGLSATSATVGDKTWKALMAHAATQVKNNA